MNVNFNYLKGIALAVIISSSAFSVANAQPPLPQGPGPVIGVSPAPGQTPPPGIPGNPGGPGNLPPVTPNPGPPTMNPNPSPPPPPPPSGWGGPGYLMNPPSNDMLNQGTINVMATGYDIQGVMKQIPLNVSYSFNGVNYDVQVLNAWDPFTQQWNIGVDVPAYSTSYYLNGFTYNYYAVLSIGTFYFNL